VTTADEQVAALVREYVSLIERSGESTPYALLWACARLLPRIYAAGLELPDVEPGDTDGSDPAVAGPNLMTSFGRYDTYFDVPDAVAEMSAAAATLSGDLVEIYLDLARPLADYDAGRVTNAVWQWKFNLRGHCGDHLTSALRAIHKLVNYHMPSDFKTGE
jgi:hypothetical protein